MAFDNTKYHCEINSVPYQIRSYSKSELSTFIPRLSPGDQQESDFDLLRSKTIKGFEGGILQRFWQEDNTVFATEGLYPIYEDGTLYPVNAISSATDIIGKARIITYANTTGLMYLAVKGYSGTNGIQVVTSAGAVSSLTLPANISSSSVTITDMLIWNSQLWVTATDGTTGRMGYMNVGGTTVTEITGGSSNNSKMVIYRGQLYLTDGSTSFGNSNLGRWTGSTSTMSSVEVATTPRRVYSDAKLLVYNNRIYLFRNDGMFAYDGVQLSHIEDKSNAVDDQNYLYPCVLQGYLYYWMPDGMYRFNGSLIEKLYDISEVGMPTDMQVGKNRLWLSYKNAEGVSSRFDKAMGYDFNTGNSIDGRIMVFNGKGMYTYRRTSTFSKNPATDDISNQGVNDKIVYFADQVYVFTYYDKIGPGTYYKVSTAERSATGNKAWALHTSIFDGDFPMIDKNLENTEIVFDGNVSSDQDITLEYRTGGFDGSTSWTALGTIKSTSRLKEYVFRTLPNGVTFKKIQFRLTGTTAATYGIAKLIFRYTLQPDVKWQWNFTALCYGDDSFSPLQLADDTESSQAVRLLRGNLYDARMSDVPIKFVDVDQLDLSGSHNSSTTTITLNSTAMLKEYGFVQIDDEVIYYAGKTSTTLTGCIRAMMGTSAASHSDNAKVFPVYRVIIRQIQNERIELTKPDIDVTEDKSRSSEISLVLQEV